MKTLPAALEAYARLIDAPSGGMANLIDAAIVEKLLEREGVTAMDSVPVIVSEPTRKDPPPSDHDLRELLHDAVEKDLLGPASGPDEEILGTSVRDRYLVGKLAPCARDEVCARKPRRQVKARGNLHTVGNARLFDDRARTAIVRPRPCARASGHVQNRDLVAIYKRITARQR